MCIVLLNVGGCVHLVTENEKNLLVRSFSEVCFCFSVTLVGWMFTSLLWDLDDCDASS